jgi:hypothetical protein
MLPKKLDQLVSRINDPSLLALQVGLRFAAGQGPGNGVSKTTYSANQALAGLNFMLKYFPVSDADDSCVGDVVNESSHFLDFILFYWFVPIVSAIALWAARTMKFNKVECHLNHPTVEWIPVLGCIL